MKFSSTGFVENEIEDSHKWKRCSIKGIQFGSVNQISLFWQLFYWFLLRSVSWTERNLAVMGCLSTLKTYSEGCCSIPDASLYSRTASKCCFHVYLSHDEVLVFLWSSSFLGGAELPCRPLLSPSPSEHLPLSCSFRHSCGSGRLIPEGASG